MTQYGQAEAFSLWAAAQNGQPFDPDALEEAVARQQLVSKTGIVSYVRIERREP